MANSSRTRSATSRRPRRGDRLDARELGFHARCAWPTNPKLLIGGVDWISKKWLLETFREAESLTWHDPWLQSLDLEYHNINPARGLFFALHAGQAHRRMEQSRPPKGRHSHSAGRHPRRRPRPSRRRLSRRANCPTSSTGIPSPARVMTSSSWAILSRLTWVSSSRVRRRQFVRQTRSINSNERIRVADSEAPLGLRRFRSRVGDEPRPEPDRLP